MKEKDYLGRWKIPLTKNGYLWGSNQFASIALYSWPPKQGYLSILNKVRVEAKKRGLVYKNYRYALRLTKLGRAYAKLYQ